MTVARAEKSPLYSRAAATDFHRLPVRGVSVIVDGAAASASRRLRKFVAFFRDTKNKLSLVLRTRLTNGSRQGTASAVPDSTQNPGVSTPEVPRADTPAIYKMSASDCLAKSPEDARYNPSPLPAAHQTLLRAIPAGKLPPAFRCAGICLYAAERCDRKIPPQDSVRASQRLRCSGSRPQASAAVAAIPLCRRYPNAA